LRELGPMVESWGARLLVNEGMAVSTPAGEVHVVGVDDINRGWPELEAAFNRAGQGVFFRILLAHAPLTVLLLPPGHGVDLALCGHTHGGQVRLPLLWRLLLPPGHGGFVRGLYTVGRMKLYVNTGFGGVGVVPLRINCPPEVAFFRLLPRASDGPVHDAPH